mmetsp:Transcript_3132/g.7817  ORF Transcript_3132/g.7817 Transcript_3132/m.7817 type:complete len:357 (+) Transcript_3132:29-1099(+)
MSTAHRPTWNPAHGGDSQSGNRFLAPRTAFSSKDLPRHLTVKQRQPGSGPQSASELKRQLEERENTARDGKPLQPRPPAEQLLDFSALEASADGGALLDPLDADEQPASSARGVTALSHGGGGSGIGAQFENEDEDADFEFAPSVPANEQYGGAAVEEEEEESDSQMEGTAALAAGVDNGLKFGANTLNSTGAQGLNVHMGVNGNVPLRVSGNLSALPAEIKISEPTEAVTVTPRSPTQKPREMGKNLSLQTDRGTPENKFLASVRGHAGGSTASPRSMEAANAISLLGGSRNLRCPSECIGSEQSWALQRPPATIAASLGFQPRAASKLGEAGPDAKRQRPAERPLPLDASVPPA